MKNKIKGISFLPEFIPLIKQGKKTVTRRIKFSGKQGDIYYFKAGRNGKKEGYIKIKSAKKESLFSIYKNYDIHEPAKEGFYKGTYIYQLNDFRELWNKLNKDEKNKYAQDPWVYRIEFKYLGEEI